MDLVHVFFMLRSQSKSITMKNTTKFALYLLLGMFSIGNAFAQVARVQDAPAWFFNPPAGEYVGVSMPLENQELAKQQAIYTALLSHVARNEWQIDGSAASIEFRLPIGYEITRTSVNQYGEKFVAVRITDRRQNQDTRVTVAHSAMLRYSTGNFESTSRLHYTIQSECSELGTTIRCVVETRNGCCKLVVEFCAICFSVQN